MRILIFTQAVDSKDTTLGFFHDWIKEIAARTESVSIICLQKGDYTLPDHVTVYSLGKNTPWRGLKRLLARIGYLMNLFRYLMLIRGSYDKVFVHMNQEYVLFAGLYWKFAGIPIYMWRNHPRGGILTRATTALSRKVFFTSPESFTARFKNAVIMPTGVDTRLFYPMPGVIRKKYSLCMVGRIAPIKHIEMALQAILQLISSGVQISCTIIGPCAHADRRYLEMLKEYVRIHEMETCVHFQDGVSWKDLPKIYSSYEICLNLTESGSFDKTIVEAAACGAIPITTNASLSTFLPGACISENYPEGLAQSIQKLLIAKEQLDIAPELTAFVQSQSLTALMNKLFIEIQ